MASGSVSVIDMPLEILGLVVANLSSKDLKTTRLVCRQWSLISIPSLFKRIYVSRRPKDLEVFRSISNHDRYQKAVRTLVYDATFLTSAYLGIAEDGGGNIVRYDGKQLYYNFLVHQLQPPVKARPSAPGVQELHALQASMNKEMRLYRLGYTYRYNQLMNSHDLTEPDCIEKREIDRGYEAYLAMACQERCSSDLLATLTHGLSNLPNLEEVQFSGNVCHQSPFCRSWPQTYLLPSRFTRVEDSINLCESLGIVYDFEKVRDDSHNFLMRALSASGRCITKFFIDDKCDYNVPFQFFDKNFMTKDNIASIIHAYSGLESLVLTLETDPYVEEDSDEPADRKDWARLQMPNLRYLSINAEYDDHDQYSEQLSLLSFDVFQDWSHPQLRELRLNGISLREDQLLGIMERQHALQSLTLGLLELDGEECLISTLDAIRNHPCRPPQVTFSGPLITASDPDVWEDLYDRECQLEGVVNQHDHYTDREPRLENKVEEYLNCSGDGVNPLIRLTTT